MCSRNVFGPISCRRHVACSQLKLRWCSLKWTRNVISPGASWASRWWCKSKSRAAPRGGCGDGGVAALCATLGEIPPTPASRNMCETIYESEIQRWKVGKRIWTILKGYRPLDDRYQQRPIIIRTDRCWMFVLIQDTHFWTRLSWRLNEHYQEFHMCSLRKGHTFITINN